MSGLKTKRRDAFATLALATFTFVDDLEQLVRRMFARDEPRGYPARL